MIDIAPEAESLTETNRRLDVIVSMAKELQASTGVQLLWGTANLFSNPRYMHGAATSPDPEVFAFASAQVKKALEITKELGGSNYVFWGGREGYENLLNTRLRQEMDQLGRFLQMAVDYKNELGFEGQFLIEPKPKEPTSHQYDFDVATGMAFLKTYGLDKDFKFNVEANHANLAGHSFAHELTLASDYGMLGSVDANRGDLLLGWDTDQFPTNLYDTTSAMMVLLKQGGLKPGGLNFDAKTRRTSFTPEDLFPAHIGGMDTFAKGLKIAFQFIEEGVLEEQLNLRYQGWGEDQGQNILNGKETFSSLEEQVFKSGEPKLFSSRVEKIENILNQYIG